MLLRAASLCTRDRYKHILINQLRGASVADGHVAIPFPCQPPRLRWQRWGTPDLVFSLQILLFHSRSSCGSEHHLKSVSESTRLTKSSTTKAHGVTFVLLPHLHGAVEALTLLDVVADQTHHLRHIWMVYACVFRTCAHSLNTTANTGLHTSRRHMRDS